MLKNKERNIIRKETNAEQVLCVILEMQFGISVNFLCTVVMDKHKRMFKIGWSSECEQFTCY